MRAAVDGGSGGVGERPRLDVVAVGTATVVDNAVDPVTHCAPCVALLCSNAPMLLVGAGPGVLRHTLQQLGQIPRAIFLPSAQGHHTAELQALIQYEASYGRKLAIYAPGDVLDRAIASIDEDIVPEVRAYVEFLQVELGAPTSFHPHYFLMTQRCDTPAVRYNAVILDTYQKPLLALIDGPLSYQSVFQQSPCAIVRMHKGFVADSMYADLGNTKLLVIGVPPDGRVVAPAAALRPGDAFVAPVVKGGTSESIGNANNNSNSNHGNGGERDPYGLRIHQAQQQPDALYVTNHGVPRMHYDPEYEAQRRSPGASASRTANWRGDQYAAQQPQQHHPAPGPRLRTGSRSPVLTGRRPPGAASTRSFQQQQPAARPAATGRGPPGLPKKIYVFNNEVKEAEPVIVMVPEHMALQALKVKIGTMLNIKPFGQLYTVDGGIVRDTADLYHCQEVVATKHAGAPFDLERLPYAMEYTRPAVGLDHALPFT